MDRRSFIKKSALAGIAGAAVTTSFAAPAIASGRIKWTMTTTWPKNFPGLGTGAAKIAEFITKASDGRLTVDVVGAGEIAPAFDAINVVGNGSVEMGHGASYYWKGKAPAAQFISSIPFGLIAQEQNAWIYYGGGQELCDEVYATMGCKFFSGGNSGTQMGGWYNRELKSTDDFKGLKLRMPGLGGEVARAAGATVVNIPGGELLTSMQSGTIDALEWVGPYNDLAFGFHKAAKYYYYPGWHEPNAILDCFVNLKAWNDLPDDLKQIVSMACQAGTVNMTSEMMARSGTALQKLKGEYKVDVRPFPNDLLKSLKQTSETVINDIASADKLSRKILDSLRKFQSEQTAWTNIAERAMLDARDL